VAGRDLRRLLRHAAWPHQHPDLQRPRPAVGLQCWCQCSALDALHWIEAAMCVAFAGAARHSVQRSATVVLCRYVHTMRHESHSPAICGSQGQPLSGRLLRRALQCNLSSQCTWFSTCTGVTPHVVVPAASACILGSQRHWVLI
jgi:hypothetical protein